MLIKLQQTLFLKVISATLYTDNAVDGHVDLMSLGEVEVEFLSRISKFSLFFPGQRTEITFYDFKPNAALIPPHHYRHSIVGNVLENPVIKEKNRPTCRRKKIKWKDLF